MTEPPVLILAGPTASGKSSAALALARTVGGEVVNADSMQVYGALRVLTARPDVPGDVPHHLYGHVGRDERYSVGRYVSEAAAVIAGARSRGAVPIVVGGTGLYLRAVTEGLSAVPSVPPAVEAEAAAAWRRDPARARAALIARDPDATSLVPADAQRHVRRMAVLAATGRTLSAWQGERSALVCGPFRAAVLSLPRAVLHERIEARAAATWEAAVEEVRELTEGGLPDGPLGRALGVAPIAAMLRGTLEEDEARDRLATDTRRYAKRQLTWFRGQTDWPWFEDMGALRAYLSEGAKASSG